MRSGSAPTSRCSISKRPSMSATPRLLILLIAQRTRRMTLAASTVERESPSESLDARSLNRRAIARLGQGDPEGALADFCQAVAVDPNFAEAWNNSGLVRQL